MFVLTQHLLLPIRCLWCLLLIACSDTDFSSQSARTDPGLGGEESEQQLEQKSTDDPSLLIDNGSVIADKCAADSETVVQQISFPSPAGCPFSQGDNLDSGDNTRARNEQVKQIVIPDNKVLCGIKLKAKGTITFDDALILAFEEHIMATNGYLGHTMAEWNMKTDGGHYLWDWLSVRGKSYNRNEPFCSPGVTCTMPPSENEGLISVDVPQQWVGGVESVYQQNRQSFDLKVIVTGNQQDTDCKHSGLNFDASVSYVDRP